MTRTTATRTYLRLQDDDCTDLRRTDDRDRCRAAHVPHEWVFATKPDLAKAMVLRAIASPLLIAWVTADAAHGQEWRLRHMLEETGLR
ncbi:MAG: transposase [Streptomyces sp.]